MIWKDITTTPSYLPNLRINVGTQGQKFVWTVYYAPVIYRLWGSMQHVQDSHLWPQWLEAVHHWQMGKCMIKHHRRRYWSMEKAVICMQESERTSHWASSKLKLLFLEPPPYTTGSLQSRQQSTAETCYTLGQSCCCYLKTNKGSTLLKVCFLCAKNYQNLSVLVETTICQIWHIFWDRVQCLFLVLHFTVFVWCLSAFSALTLLVGGEEGHLTCKCLTPTKQLPKDSRGDFGRLTQLNRRVKSISSNSSSLPGNDLIDLDAKASAVNSYEQYQSVFYVLWTSYISSLEFFQQIRGTYISMLVAPEFWTLF